MIRLGLRLLIVMFMLQSTWAVAAQYCRHELGLDAFHIGHHTHEHKTGDQSQVDQTVLKADNNAAPSIDSDCPYCHLGAMKSMLSISVVAPSAAAPPHPVELTLAYPGNIPFEPERPNWLLAA
jgi:hypothetical protein